MMPFTSAHPAVRSNAVVKDFATGWTKWLYSPTVTILPNVLMRPTRTQSSASEVTTLWRYTNLFISIRAY